MSLCKRVNWWWKQSGPDSSISKWPVYGVERIHYLLFSWWFGQSLGVHLEWTSCLGVVHILVRVLVIGQGNETLGQLQDPNENMDDTKAGSPQRKGIEGRNYLEKPWTFRDSDSSLVRTWNEGLLLILVYLKAKRLNKLVSGDTSVFILQFFLPPNLCILKSILQVPLPCIALFLGIVQTK